MCFSSHSAANGLIASAVNFRAISWIWSWSSVRSNWLIAGGSRAARRCQQDRLGGGFLLQQSLEAKDIADRIPLLHPLVKGAQVGPAVDAAEHLVGPPHHHEQIGIGQGEIRPEQVRTGPEPLVDIVELLAELSDDQ